MFPRCRRFVRCRRCVRLTCSFCFLSKRNAQPNHAPAWLMCGVVYRSARGKSNLHIRAGRSLLGRQPVGPDPRVDPERRLHGDRPPPSPPPRRRAPRRPRPPGASNTSSSCTCRTRREPGKSCRQPVVAADHGHLDDVGGAALDDRVHGQPLSQRALLEVARGQLGDGPAAAEDRGHVALPPGGLDGGFDEGLHPRQALEVALDVGGRLFPARSPGSG